MFLELFLLKNKYGLTWKCS